MNLKKKEVGNGEHSLVLRTILETKSFTKKGRDFDSSLDH